jgi:glycosyltransferase involved in cell wall biosynthesis
VNKLSFVIPCYRSEKTLPSVINEIILCVTKLKKYSYEIILVNDNSPDNTFSVIQELCKGNRNIKSLDLSRNFGQHSATLAGFAFVKGDIIITVDDDGQIPIDELPILLDKMNEGYDIVMGEYNESKHSGLLVFFVYLQRANFYTSNSNRI